MEKPHGRKENAGLGWVREPRRLLQEPLPGEALWARAEPQGPPGAITPAATWLPPSRALPRQAVRPGPLCLLSNRLLTCKMGVFRVAAAPGMGRWRGRWGDDGAESTLVAAHPVPSFLHGRTPLVPALGVVPGADTSGFPSARADSNLVPGHNPMLGKEC